MRVLVVEDELAAGKGLTRILRQMDDRVEVVGYASNGQQGLAQLHALSPDAAFVDICMPVMDGLEMIREARAQGLKTQFVVTSAFAEFEYARQAISLDVREYLVKPITLDDLSIALSHIMPKEESQVNNAYHPMVGRTLAIIGEKYGEPINLASISEQLKVTPEYLSYLFHRDMGINFSTYLRQVRIDHAFELMKNGSNRIYEIAHAVGFSDAKYFYRVFREVTGKSPGVYIRELAEQRAAGAGEQ